MDVSQAGPTELTQGLLNTYVGGRLLAVNTATGAAFRGPIEAARIVGTTVETTMFSISLRSAAELTGDTWCQSDEIDWADALAGHDVFVDEAGQLCIDCPTTGDTLTLYPPGSVPPDVA